MHLDDEFKGRFDPRVWRSLLGYLRNYRWAAARLALGGATIAAAEGYLPVLNGRMIDIATQERTFASLAPLLALYTILFAIFAACVWLFIKAAGELATGMGFDLRRDAFAKLQDLSFSFFDARPVGWLTSRLTSDCARVANILPWVILDLFWGTLLLCVVVVAMFWIDWRLALATCSIVPFLAATSVVFQRVMLQSSRQSRRTNSAMTASFNEALLGVRTTKTLVREERNLEEFARLSSEMRRWMLKNAIQSSIYLPLVMTIGSVGAAIALGRGGAAMLGGYGLSIGKLVSFMQFAVLFQHPIQELAQRFADILNASSAAERVTSLLATEPQIKDGPGATIGPSRIREIRFDHVSFGYKPDVPVLHDFCLTVREGQTIALVGATGGGKSTIVSLAARFYEPTSGRILLDGVDYRERSLHWLQSNLGVVQQSPHLFSGSIRENIRYGKLDATDVEIEAAAKRVNADEMIRSLENGYEFQVGECGDRLSTGQRQLVALARAVLRDPQIFIMDEATSSVDTATERLIQGGIEEVLRARIAFVIAHRLSTIRRADVIVVIDSGRIVEQGGHKELIARRGRYFELYTHQYAAEREAALFGAPSESPRA
ncbi:MAG: ABC transporter ATP-binding protein [Phycisphaerales bacterium]